MGIIGNFSKMLKPVLQKHIQECEDNKKKEQQEQNKKFNNLDLERLEYVLWESLEYVFKSIKRQTK